MEKLLASQKSFWQWEYDRNVVTAEVYEAESKDSYHLIIVNKHTKTGIGAGTFTKVEFDGYVPLEEIDKITKKFSHKRGRLSSAFSKNKWETPDGRKGTLQQLIKGSYSKLKEVIRRIVKEEIFKERWSEDICKTCKKPQTQCTCGEEEDDKKTKKKEKERKTSESCGSVKPVLKKKYREKLKEVIRKIVEEEIFKYRKQDEVAPPGWSGTVKAMEKHKNITNPYALAHYMAKRGAKPHYKPIKKRTK